MPRNNDGSRYYGIEKGRETGVTNNWEKAEQQVKGYPENSYKRFDNPDEARRFANGNHERSQGDTKFYGRQPYDRKR